MPTNDISAIKGYIEKYDRSLIGQMLNGLDVVSDLTVRRNVREPINLYKMTVDAGVRRLNVDINSPKGGRVWSGRKLTPGFGMKIMSIIPEELRETFMSEMLDPNANREPFAAWAWREEFNKIASEINDNFYLSVNTGVPDAFAPGDTYTAGDYVYFNEIVYECVTNTSAGESPTTHAAKWKDIDQTSVFDGLGTIIASEITGANLSAVATGTWDHTDGYESVHEVWATIPEAHKNKGMTLYVSFDGAQDIAERQNTLYGSGKGVAGVDVDGANGFVVKNTGGRLRVKPATWMGASRRMIVTYKENLVVGVNQTSDVNKVGKLVETLHGYDAIVKYAFGFQIRDLEVLYVNDQA